MGKRTNILQKMKGIPYADMLAGGLGMQIERDKDCAVCLIEFANHDQVVKCPNKHVFHETCFSDWIKNGVNVTCPVCRVEMPV